MQAKRSFELPAIQNCKPGGLASPALCPAPLDGKYWQDVKLRLPQKGTKKHLTAEGGGHEMSEMWRKER
jgi:hypothetical protein